LKPKKKKTQKNKQKRVTKGESPQLATAGETRKAIWFGLEERRSANTRRGEEDLRKRGKQEGGGVKWTLC